MLAKEPLPKAKVSLGFRKLERHISVHCQLAKKAAHGDTKSCLRTTFEMYKWSLVQLREGLCVLHDWRNSELPS
jgi:hypothetical protein